MKKLEPTVFVVDDDEAVRSSVKWLVQSAGWNVKTHASAHEFLEDYDPARPGCLVLDVRMPGMSGLELQELMKSRGLEIPVIFITGHGDVPMAVRAVKAGAIDFIQKPFGDEHLLGRIQLAIEKDKKARELREGQEGMTLLLGRLTPREHDVLQLLVEGCSLKEVAAKLYRSYKTVDNHKGSIMRKLEVTDRVDLVKFAIRAGVAKA